MEMLVSRFDLRVSYGTNLTGQNWLLGTIIGPPQKL
jgi:hypothetical protein